MLSDVLALLGEHRETSLMHICVGIDVVYGGDTILFLGWRRNILTAGILFEVLFLGLFHLFEKHGFLAMRSLHTLFLRLSLFLCEITIFSASFRTELLRGKG